MVAYTFREELYEVEAEDDEEPKPVIDPRLVPAVPSYDRFVLGMCPTLLLLCDD